jgi:hypothetical protein
MGYALIWVESLAVALLVPALVAACAARWPGRLRQAGPPVLTAVLLVGLAACVTWAAGFFRFQAFLDSVPFWSLLAWTILFAVGTVLLLARGLRRRPEGDVPAARSWPRGRLALALAVAVILAGTTFTNLDLAVKVQLAGVRAEAGAKALALAPARVPDRDNAAPVYQEAFAALTPADKVPPPWHDKAATWFAPDGTAFDAGDKDLADFLATQERGLALLRKAAALPGCSFAWDYSRGIELRLPELQQLRHGARLLALDARARAARRDGPSALADVAALFGIARHLNEPILISIFLAAAVEEMGVRALEEVLAHTTPQPGQLAPLSASLGQGASYRTQVRRAFQMEEAAMGLSSFAMLAGENTAECSQALGALCGEQAAGRVLCSPLYRVFFVPGDLAAYRRTMGQMQELAARPYYESHEDWAEFDRQFRRHRGGVLTNLIIPAGPKCARRAAEVDALRQLARLALAVTVYRAQEGKYPDTLNDLLPGYIAEIPSDPFDGKPLRSRPDGKGLVVYSIGPDLKDDGGVAWDASRWQGDLLFRLR